MLVYKKNILLQCRRSQRCGKQGYSPDGLERCSHIAEVIGSSPIIPTNPKKVQENKSLFFLNLFFSSCLAATFFRHPFMNAVRRERDESRPYHSYFTLPFLEALMRKVYYSLMLFFLALLSLLILSSAVTTYRYLVLPST